MSGMKGGCCDEKKNAMRSVMIQLRQCLPKLCEKKCRDEKNNATRPAMVQLRQLFDTYNRVGVITTQSPPSSIEWSLVDNGLALLETSH